MEFLVALIELRVLVVVVGTIDLPGGRGTLDFFYTGLCLPQKRTFSLLQNFPLKRIPCPIYSVEDTCAKYSLFQNCF